MICSINSTKDEMLFKCLKSSVFAAFLSVVEESGFERDKGVGESSNCITSFRGVLRFFCISNSLANISRSVLMTTSLFFTLIFAGADLLSNVRNFNFLIGA